MNRAWLTPTTKREFAPGTYALQSEDWVEGDRLWFPGFVAPFGHARATVGDLRQRVFRKGTPAKAPHIGSDGTVRTIATYRLWGKR